MECFSHRAAVDKRTAKGGTGRESVLEQIAVMKNLLETGNIDAWGRLKPKARSANCRTKQACYC